MKVILELTIEETVSVDTLEELAGRAMEAMSGHGPRVHSRLLVEMSPNYLEIPMHHTMKPSKAV